MRPVVEPVIETTCTARPFSRILVNLTTKDAKRLYYCIDAVFSRLGVDSAGSRGNLPEAQSLYELYDALYEAGVAS